MFAGVLLTGCQTTLPTSDPNAPVISWAVYDKQDRTTHSFPATGGRFTVVDSHTYFVTVRADNPGGVHKLTEDGSGTFKCVTMPDKNGSYWTDPDLVNLSVPHQEETYFPDSNNQVETHIILNGDFDYYHISCGFHNYGNTPGNLEYFVSQGMMNFTASASNYFGVSSQGSFAIGQ